MMLSVSVSLFMIIMFLGFSSSLFTQFTQITVLNNICKYRRQSSSLTFSKTFKLAYSQRYQSTSSGKISNLGDNNVNTNIKNDNTDSIQHTEPIDIDNNIKSTNVSLNLHYGKAVNVKVAKFGPLGASVQLIDYQPATGLILQKELARFRDKRDGEEVVIGETLVGYVERIREENKIDISLRPGVVSRITEVKELIMDALLGSPSGTILVGDKSTSEDIANYFHGVSKTDFKNAIGSLYKEALIQPGKLSTSLMTASETVKKAGVVSSSPSPSPSGSKRYAKTVFVGNLPSNTQHAELETFLLEKLGSTDMKQLRVSMDQVTKKCRGFAYVDIADEVDDLEVIVSKIKNQNYGGRSLRCDVDRKEQRGSGDSSRTKPPSTS